MSWRQLRAATMAGVAYFGIVFALGFLLGTIRVLILLPRVGEATALLVELPLMLTVSWLACSWLAARFIVSPQFPARLMMGALAFAMLMVAELAVSIFGFGRTVSEHLAQYHNPLTLLGLVAQFLFALFPISQTGIGVARQIRH